tara:strand:+ start:1246 stop:2151 length:906 start_codon:yes stop_codon:yes gene_type:complete
MKIIFYNHYHRGDIHFSRSFVDHTVRSLRETRGDIEFLYMHQNSPDTVSDIANVTEVANQQILWPNKVQIVSGVQEDGELLLGINTWVGSSDDFRKDCGCCFTGNLKLWQIIWNTIDNDHGLKVAPPLNTDDLLPKIDYDHYHHCSFVDDHLRATDSKYNKRIFVSNGPVLSSQAVNFDFDPIIMKIAEDHPECAFYMTDNSSLEGPNIYSTRELINKDGCDLNENSYLSRSCDVLVGRASGPFAFSCCHDNFMDKNKTLCIFTNGIGEGAWFTDGQCTYEWCKSEDLIKIENIIRTSIGE